jgi:nucleoside-diphosphate-sugar epimerase
LGDRATIIRPTWIYGPRDPANIPAALNAARHGRAWLIGSGDNVLNMVSVAHVAEAAILAANHPAARGQAYNICGEYQLTQRQMMNMVCQAVGVPLVRRHLPYPIVHAFGFLLELAGRLLRRKRKPFITRHGMSVYVRPIDYSWEKAERDLGLRPPSDTHERFAETLRWFQDTRV